MKEQLKLDFKALLAKAGELPVNEAITLLSTLQGYVEAKIEALQENANKRQYNRKQAPELRLKE